MLPERYWLKARPLKLKGLGVIIGIMENKMEISIMGHMGIMGYILGFRV